jgi:hypothetical protein
MATLDPSLPADHAPIVSAELRTQFQAIQERYDNLLLVQPLGLQVADPPTQAEVQAIADKLDELINRVQGG